MLRILFICPFLPEKNAPQAGHRLAYEYIKKFSLSATVDVVLLLKDKKIAIRSFPDISNVNIIYQAQISKTSLIMNLLKSPRWFSFLTRYNQKIKDNLIDIVKSGNYDIINLEFSQTFYHMTYLNDFTKSEFHLSAHDILTQSHLRKVGIMSYFSNWTFRAEHKLLNLADKIFVLSEKDRNLVHALFGSQLDVELRPLPLPDYIYRVRRTIDTIEQQSLMFWGAMNRPENERSIINFISTIFPELLKEYPGLKLYVVGANPTVKLKKFESDSIVITGFVENPASFFEKASIGIIPLLYGAGVKLKTLEMMETGMPVISTPIGVEGISLKNHNNIFVEEIGGFASLIKKHLNNDYHN